MIDLRLKRRQLPAEVDLWAGGEMTRRLRRNLVGVRVLPDLNGVLTSVAEWRATKSLATP